MQREYQEIMSALIQKYMERNERMVSKEKTGKPTPHNMFMQLTTQDIERLLPLLNEKQEEGVLLLVRSIIHVKRTAHVTDIGVYLSSQSNQTIASCDDMLIKHGLFHTYYDAVSPDLANEKEKRGIILFIPAKYVEKNLYLHVDWSYTLEDKKYRQQYLYPLTFPEKVAQKGKQYIAAMTSDPSTWKSLSKQYEVAAVVEDIEKERFNISAMDDKMEFDQKQIQLQRGGDIYTPQVRGIALTSFRHKEVDILQLYYQEVVFDSDNIYFVCETETSGRKKG